MQNGTYNIFKIASYENDKEILGNKIGSFSVDNGNIIAVSNNLRELLQEGPINGMNEYRINHTFNNGYYKIVKKD